MSADIVHDDIVYLTIRCIFHFKLISVGLKILNILVMFSRLSNYIWSTGSDDQTVPGRCDDINLLERGEDEWILVDFANEKTKNHSGMTARHTFNLYACIAQNIHLSFSVICTCNRNL